MEHKTPDGYSFWQKEERCLIRCNYGWDGACDGYYLNGVFNTNEWDITPAAGKEEWVEPNVPYSKSVTPGYYQYELNIIPNIHP